MQPARPKQTFLPGLTRYRYGYLILLLILAQPLQAFADDSTAHMPPTIPPGATTLDSANMYFNYAKSLQHSTQHAIAIEYYEKARGMYEVLKKEEFYVTCLTEIGAHLIDLRQFERAADTLYRAIEIGEHQLDNADPEAVSRAYYLLGFLHFEQGRTQEALDFYEQALDYGIRHLGENHVAIANYYGSIASLYRYFEADHEKAYEMLQKAIAIRTNINKIDDPRFAYDYMKLGKYYDDKEEYQRALDYYEKGLAIIKNTLGDQHQYAAKFYFDMATSYDSMGEYQKALDLCQKSIDITISLMGPHSKYLSYMYSLKGECLSSLGDYGRAITFYQKGLNISINAYGKDHRSIPTALHNLASAQLARGNTKSAKNYLYRAIDVSVAYHGEKHRNIANLYATLGKAHILEGQRDSATYYYQKALPMYMDVFDGEITDLAALLRSSSEIDLNDGNFSQAMEKLRTALALNIDKLGRHHGAVAKTQRSIGALYRRSGDLANALKHYQKAIHTIRSSCSESDVHANPQNVAHLADNYLLAILIEKAETAREMHRKDSGDTEGLQLALATYQSAIGMFNALHRSYNDPQTRDFLRTDVVTQLFDGAVEAAAELYNVTQASEFLEAAYGFAENSKSIVLLETLKAADVALAARMPDSVLAVERSLRMELALIDEEIGAAVRSDLGLEMDKVGRLYDKKFQLSTVYEDFIWGVRVKYPMYYALKFDYDVARISDARRLIQDSAAALIEYYVGDKDLFVFTLSQSDAFLQRIPYDSAARACLQGFRATLRVDNVVSAQSDMCEMYAERAYDVYKLLLEPALRSVARLPIQTLIIVPDRELCFVPFEAMITQPAAGDAARFPTLEYLLRSYRISYAYSSSVLQELQRDDRQALRELQTSIGFAPEFIAANGAPTAAVSANDSLLSNLYPLMWSEQEVAAVQRSLGGLAITGAQASESAFKRESPNYRVIHLATHGLINQAKPLQSCIAFSAADSADDDGLLFVHEIYALALQAELVTLSACNTGVGAFSSGEGVMSISRAFSYAGVPSVIMSLWPVNDQTTASIMEYLYENLDEGYSKDEALRQAKLRYLNRADNVLAHPALWSTFLLMGDVAPLPRHNERQWYWMAAILVVLIGGGSGIGLRAARKRRIRQSV